MNENDAKDTPGPAAHAEGTNHGTGSEWSIPVSDDGIPLSMTADGYSFNQDENAGSATNKPYRATPET